MSTTVGETAADFLNMDLGFGLINTSFVVGGLLAVTLYFQMRATRYIPVLYWLVVVFISVFGTLVTDNLTDAWHAAGMVFNLFHAGIDHDLCCLVSPGKNALYSSCR
jgi:uncharacterized membrane-anchored protein